jgi:hypothetical protein
MNMDTTGLLLLLIACSPPGAAVDPPSLQTPSQSKAAAKAQEGVILGKLHFAKRNEKGEWVRRADRPGRDSTKQTNKKETARPKPESTNAGKKMEPPKTDDPLQFYDKLLPYIETLDSADFPEYIAGMSSEAAIWEFERLPPKLANRGQVQVRLGYDIFATVKGFDGVAEADITFINRKKWNPGRLAEYRKAKEHKSDQPVKPEKLAHEFGIFELQGVRLMADRNKQSSMAFSGSLLTDLKNAILGARPPIEDQPSSVTFPGSLPTDLKDGILEVRVQCRTNGVFLGFRADDLVIVTRP